MFYLLLSSCVFITSTQAVDIAEDVLPVITEHPLDVIVAKGEPAALNCAAKGRDLEISWYKDGVKVITNKDETTSHRLILQTGALFLLRVNNGKSGKDADSGTYYCVAKNKYGEARSREASLKIAMLRDDFRTRPRTTQAVIGNRAVMECVPPRGFPEPVVSWRKNDVEFRAQDDDRVTMLPSGNLIIDKVQRSDAGLYQCIATNMVGQKVSSPARLSVYEKPYFLQEPRDVTADVGTSVLFDCRVSGDPMPSITWKKRNQQMPVGRAYIATDNRGLRIDRIEASDEGEYLCQAKNPAGSIETSARLRVHSAPTFIKTPLDVSVESGQSVHFDCEAQGQPPPASFWSKEGQQDLLFPGHTSLDGRAKVSLDGRLTITDTRPADEGNYVCAAMNAAGSTLAKAQLKVDSKTLPSNPPPIIEHAHSNQTLMVSASAILPCQASGRVTPQIDWLKNGELIINEIANDERFTQLNTGSLRISDLRKSDTGLYTCRARNVDGESTWTASLIVEEHTNPSVTFNRMPDMSTFPSAPGKPVVSNVTDSSATIQWTAPEKSGATLVTGYILQYFCRELGETWFNVANFISTTRYRINELKPSHSYVFIVRAENSHGIGAPSEMSDVVRTKPTRAEKELKSANSDLELARQRIASEQLLKLDEVKTINSTAVQLTWKKRRSEPLIEGYYIKWRSIKSWHSGENGWLNVSKSSVTSFVINNLKAFTTYEFFVIPYHKSVQGMPSNSLDVTTDEAAPTSPPSEVRIRMMNLTTLRISWRPPASDGINGILKGFQIVILGSDAKYNRNISTNERAASVTLFHLVPSMSYNIKVAAKSNAGVGVFTRVFRVTMDEETLEEHNRLMSGIGTASDRLLYVIKRPWFIAVSGVLMWILFVALIALIWWRWKRSKGKDAGMPFIKINDGSVHLTARDALWMDHTNFNMNTAQRTLLLNTNNSQNAAAAAAAASLPYIGNEYNCKPPTAPSNVDYYIDHRHYNDSSTTTTHSPNHYQYATTTGSTPTAAAAAAAAYGGVQPCAADAVNTIMSTFYATNNLMAGGAAVKPSSFHQQPQIMDDPSPYATTTLVMSGATPASNSSAQQDARWLKEHMLRAPTPLLPSNPVPSEPPPRFQDIAFNTPSSQLNGCSSLLLAKRIHNTNKRHLRDMSSPINHHKSKSGRRTPPKQTLLDLMPPPPPGEPPPENIMQEYLNEVQVRGAAAEENANDHYDAVSDSLLLPSHYCTASRSINNDKRIHDDVTNKDIAISNDTSASSSCSSTLNQEIVRLKANEQHYSDSRLTTAAAAANEVDNDMDASYASSAHRRQQPCMGINAVSSLSYDGTSSKRSTARLKSLARNSQKDLV